MVFNLILLFLQLEGSAQRLKVTFDNINIDWNLSHDDGSTDFSDDDTIIDDRNGSLTPEKKSRSRPPSYTGGDSPVTLRSRSSTCDSLQSGSSPNSNNRQMPPPPPPQSRKPAISKLINRINNLLCIMRFINYEIFY